MATSAMRGIGLSLALVAVTSAAWAEPLEQRFSKEYVLLVSVNDAAALGAALQQTALGATWREPEVQRLFAPALKNFDESVKERWGLSLDELFHALPGQAIFGLAPPKKDQERHGEPRQAILIRLGAAKATLERILARARKDLAAEAPEGSEEGRAAAEARRAAEARAAEEARLLAEAMKAGDDAQRAAAARAADEARKAAAARAAAEARRWRRAQYQKGNLPDGTPFEQFDRNLVVAVKDDLFGMASDVETLGELMKGPLPEGARLCDKPEFKAALKPLAADRPETMYVCLDLAGTLARVQADGDIDTPVRAVLDHLGILEVKAVAGAFRPAGKEIRSQWHIYAPGWTKGLLLPCGQGARALLQTVPPEAVGASAFRFDPRKLLDLIAGAVAASEKAGREAPRGIPGAMDKTDTLDHYSESIAEASETHRVDLRKDVIEAVAASEKAGREDVRGLPGAMDETDTLDHFSEWLAEAGETLGVDLRKDLIEALGPEVVIYLLPWDDPPGSLLPRLVLEAPLTHGDRLTKALDTLGAKLSQALKDGPARYQRQEEGGATVHVVSSMVPPLQVVVAVSGNRLVVATRKADALAAVARGGKPLERSFLARPGVAQALDRVGADGTLVGFFDLQGVMTTLYKSLVPMLLQSVNQARGAARGAQCASNLRQTGLGIMTYAAAHDDKLPASLEEVGKAGVLGEDFEGTLKCPATGLKYHYVAYPDKKLEDLKPDAILAYELTAPHNGARNVLFVDGHVERMSAEKFAKALEGVPANLRGKDPAPGEIKPPATQEAGLPGLGPLPSAEALFKHLPPGVECLTVTPDGALWTTESMFPQLPVYLPFVAYWWVAAIF